MRKYHFYKASPTKIVCTTTFNGKILRGVAIAADGDTFDEEKGKQLAKMRVDVKFAKEKIKARAADLETAQKELDKANAKFWKIKTRLQEANKEWFKLHAEMMRYADSL